MHHAPYPDRHHDPYAKTVFGFWVYLLSDSILFAALLATLIVLQTPAAAQVVHDLPHLFLQSVVLLTCSCIAGLAGAFAHRKDRISTLLLFSLTAVLGGLFIAIEWNDGSTLIHRGDTWTKNGFLSILFTLLGTHALHVVFAILWTLLLLPLVMRDGLSSTVLQRLVCLKMFWQFLNIVWILLLTSIYWVQP